MEENKKKLKQFVKRIEKGEFDDLSGMSESELIALGEEASEAYRELPEEIRNRTHIVITGKEYGDEKDNLQFIGFFGTIHKALERIKEERDRTRLQELRREKRLFQSSAHIRTIIDCAEQPYTPHEPSRKELTAETASILTYEELENIVDRAAHEKQMLCQDLRAVEYNLASYQALEESKAINRIIAEMKDRQKRLRASIGLREASLEAATAEMERRELEAARKSAVTRNLPEALAELENRVSNIEIKA